MNFLKFPVGNADPGTVVVITLQGVESDVFLVDDANLGCFERGQSFQYTGGHYRQSPARLRVPSHGNWTAIVVPSPGGQVSASAQVIAA
jgi:hypothetical protein